MPNSDSLMKEIDKSGDALGDIMTSARKRSDEMRINGNWQGSRAAQALFHKAGRIAALRLRLKIKEIDNSEKMNKAIASFKKINKDLTDEAKQIKVLGNKLDKAKRLIASLEKLLKQVAKMAA